MAIVGDKSTFAIEWEVTGAEAGYVFAKFCYWVASEQVGDYEDEVVFGAVVGITKRYLDLYDQRNISHLADATKEEVFDYVYESVMGRAKGKEIPRDQPTDWHLLEKLQSVFHLTNCGGAAFWDHVAIILVNDETRKKQRLIWKCRNTDLVNEVILDEKAFDLVASEFIAVAEKTL